MSKSLTPKEGRAGWFDDVGRRFTRDSLTVAVYRGAAFVARSMPEWAAERSAQVLTVALRHVLKSRREMVARHQARLSGRTFTDAERTVAVNEAFSTYARYWVNLFRLTGASTERIDAEIAVDGSEHVDAALSKGHGVIMAMPHIGAWDLGGAWVGHHWPLTVVAERVEPPELFEWFCERRKANNITVVPLDHDAGGALLASLRRNEVLGLLCDRDIAGGGVEVEFFGERTTLPAGPATLSLRTGAPILPVVVYQRPGQPAHGVIRPPIQFVRSGKLRTDVAALTQLVANELEALIRVAPEQWHVLQPNWPSDRSI